MIPPPPPHHHHHHHDLRRRRRHRRRRRRCHHCHRCHYTIVIIAPQQRVNNRKDHPSPAEKATAIVFCSLPSWESKSLIPAVASETSSLWPTECGYCWCWWCWWWRRRKQFRRRQWHCDVYSSPKKNVNCILSSYCMQFSSFFDTKRRGRRGPGWRGISSINDRTATFKGETQLFHQWIPGLFHGFSKWVCLKIGYIPNEIAS